MTGPALHLPDLPEVQVQLGLSADTTAARQRSRRAQPWYHLLLQGVSSYLPLLLMAFLAAGTWWLVRNTPPRLARAPKARRARRPTTP